MKFKEQPWIPADATDYIHEISKNPSEIAYKLHAKERMEERNILTGDVLYVLRNGYVYEDPEPATRGFFRYKVEYVSPNSGKRTLRVVVLADEKQRSLKIITVMFVDE
jgi:hypothetical protein